MEFLRLNRNNDDNTDDNGILVSTICIPLMKENIMQGNYTHTKK